MMRCTSSEMPWASSYGHLFGTKEFWPQCHMIPVLRTQYMYRYGTLGPFSEPGWPPASTAFTVTILFILGASFNVFIYIGGSGILSFSINNENNTCFIEFVCFSSKVGHQFTKRGQPPRGGSAPIRIKFEGEPPVYI